MPIKIDFQADVRDLVRGTDTVDEALGKVGDKLDDVGAAGSESASQVSDSLGDVGDSAIDSSGKLGDLGAAGRQALDGDLGGAAKTAAGALSAIGPIGAVAGTVAAAGITLISGAIEARQKELDELKKKFSEMYASAAKEGRTFLDDAQVQNEALDILFNSDRSAELDKAKAAAAATGLTLNEVLLAQAGDQKSLNDVLAVGNTLLADATTKVNSFQGATQGTKNPLLEQALGTQTALQSVVDQYTDVGNVIDENKGKAELAQGIVGTLEQQQADAIKRTSDADTARWAAYSAAYQAAAAKAPIVVQVDTSQAQRDLDSFLRQPRRVNIIAKVPLGQATP